MGGEHVTEQPQSSCYEVKASALRGYILVINQLGLMPAVLRGVPEDVRMMIEHPPSSSAWIDARPTEEILGVVETIRGMDAVRDVSRTALNLTVAPLVMPVVQGALRLFGADPGTLFTRTELLTRSNLRGVEFEYAAKSARSGSMLIKFPRDRDTPMRRFVAFAGALEINFILTRTPGVIEPPVRISGPEQNGARYEVRW